MKRQTNKIAGMLVNALSFAVVFATVAPAKVFADAQCAYNICPRDTSIIYQNGNVAITDVQVAVLAVLLVIGVLFILNGKKIKENLSK